MKTMMRGQKGFTLVEMAIVLVIIGILLGSVIKGQQMINNAKIKAVVDQQKSITAAIYAYQDKYGELPGDDNAAANRSWATGTCATTIGNSNGLITSPAESFAAAEHLACAGFITGSYDGIAQNMAHKYGGDVIILNATTAGRTGNTIRFTGLRAEDAQAVDRMLDDGIYDNGSCRATAVYAAETIITNFDCFL